MFCGQPKFFTDSDLTEYKNCMMALFLTPATPHLKCIENIEEYWYKYTVIKKGTNTG
jgi:ferredoxin-thioredoxin reductase catalytic subunit